MNKQNDNIDKNISDYKPAIFWKDKELTKQQIYKWEPSNIKKLIYKLNEIELLIKKNLNKNPLSFSVIISCNSTLII